MSFREGARKHASLPFAPPRSPHNLVKGSCIVMGGIPGWRAQSTFFLRFCFGVLVFLVCFFGVARGSWGGLLLFLGLVFVVVVYFSHSKKGEFLSHRSATFLCI